MAKPSGGAKGPAFSRTAFDTWFKDTLKELLSRRIPPASIESLLEQLKLALPAHLKKGKSGITRERIFAGFDDLFWNRHKNILGRLEKVRLSADELLDLIKRNSEHNALMPPKWVVQLHVDEMYGLTKTPRMAPNAVLRGILQVDFFGADKSKQLPPASTPAAPFHALSGFKTGRMRTVWINAPKLGRVYTKNIAKNEVRCALSAARKIGADAIVIGGGLFHLLMQKTAGPQRLVYDRINGVELDVEDIVKRHQHVWREALVKGSLQPLWRTTAEEYGAVWRGWGKVSHRPNRQYPNRLGPPEFPKDVYIVLNDDDVAIVRKLYYNFMRYQSILKQNEARALAPVKAKLAEAAKERWVIALRSGNAARIKQAKLEYDEAEEEARAAAEDITRYQVTNTDSAQNVKLVDEAALPHFIEAIENAIPGAKVIDQNTAYVRFAGNPELTKIVSADGAGRPWDNELDKAGEEQRLNPSDPSVDLSDQVANNVVIMGPRAVFGRQTAREHYRQGSMLWEPVKYIECPMLIDPEPIRERLRGTKVRIPFVQAIQNARYAAGMTVIDFYPDKPSDVWFLRLGAVRHFGTIEENKVKRSMPKYFYIMESSDPHLGGKMRILHTLPSGMRLGGTEAALHLMKPYLEKHNGRAPVVSFIMADDALQGNHIEGHNRIHPEWVTGAEINLQGNAWMQRIDSLQDPAERDREHKRFIAWQAHQLSVRQPDHVGSQLEEFHQAIIRPYADVFKGILLNAYDKGVILQTLSDIKKCPDSRDIGLINFPCGNHMANSTKNTTFEGDILVNYLRNMLLRDPDLARLGLSIDRLIRAPKAQTRTQGHGIIQVGKSGFRYGVTILNAPPARNSWNDPLEAWSRLIQRQGNYSTILENLFEVLFTGDKHFFMMEMTHRRVVNMSPPDTHTDEYANVAGGLPPNNAGKKFLRLCVDGPDRGDIGSVHLTPKTMQDYLDSGKPFPWEDFLPGSEW